MGEGDVADRGGEMLQVGAGEECRRDGGRTEHRRRGEEGGEVGEEEWAREEGREGMPEERKPREEKQHGKKCVRSYICSIEQAAQR